MKAVVQSIRDSEIKVDENYYRGEKWQLENLDKK